MTTTPETRVVPDAATVCKTLAPYLGATATNDWSGLRDDDAVSMSVKLRVGDLRALEDVAAAPAAPVQEPVGDELRWRVEFMLDRLEEFGREIDDDYPDVAVRDWFGLVTPAIARVRSALAAMPAPVAASAVDEREWSVMNRNGKQWHVVSPCGSWTMRPEGNVTAQDAESICWAVVRAMNATLPSPNHVAASAVNVMREALAIVEEVLADIVNATTIPGDFVAWAAKRASEALPDVRKALAATPSSPNPVAASAVDEKRLRDAADSAAIWLKSALDCKDWAWDADQHEAATWCLAELRAILDTPVAASAVDGGLRAAIRFLEQRHDDYVRDHGIYDPSTGVTEFPGDGDEYVGELEEIIDGLKALATTPPSDDSNARQPVKESTVRYRNWRGEVSDRVIVPLRVWHAATEWHPEPQMLLRAWDVEKQAVRDFALADFLPPAAEGSR